MLKKIKNIFKLKEETENNLAKIIISNTPGNSGLVMTADSEPVEKLYSSYTKGDEMRRTLILCSTQGRGITPKRTEDHRPIIIVTGNSALPRYIEESDKEREIANNITYAEMTDVSLQDNKDKVFIFTIKGNNFHNTLEIAMLLNKKLLEANYIPNIIIDSFEEIYDESYTDDIDEFYEEMFEENIQKEQSVLILSDGLYLEDVPNRNKKFNKKLINSLNTIIAMPEYFYSAKYNEPRINGFKTILEDIEDKKISANLMKNFEEDINAGPPTAENMMIFFLREPQETGE